MVAEFPVNPQRLDPYKNFRVRLKWGNGCVAGFSQVNLLNSDIAMASIQAGGSPVAAHVAPGQIFYTPIVLARGMTSDASFMYWANRVFDNRNSGMAAPANNGSLADYRRNVTVELFNEAGQCIIAYNIYKAWVSQYTALPALDGGDTTTAIQSITLENEGWQRDPSVTHVTEPSFNTPAA